MSAVSFAFLALILSLGWATMRCALVLLYELNGY